MKFTVRREGQIENIEIQKSCGDLATEKSLIAALQKISPIKPPHDDFSELYLNLIFSYERSASKPKARAILLQNSCE